MIEFLAAAALMGLPATYALHCLLLEQKTGHYGPFRSATRTITFVSTSHEQPAVLWDYVRRLFGVYTVVEGKWMVEESRVAVERFTCPFCLSMWVSLPFSIFFLLKYFGFNLDAALWFIPVHLLICTVSYGVHRALWD